MNEQIIESLKTLPGQSTKAVSVALSIPYSRAYYALRSLETEGRVTYTYGRGSAKKGPASKLWSVAQ